MAYCEQLATRVRGYFSGRSDVEEKKMFGGLAFMVAGHMCVGIKGNALMARVGQAFHNTALALPGTRVMDFTGKSLNGFVYVDAESTVSDSALQDWIKRCESFVLSLPPK